MKKYYIAFTEEYLDASMQKPYLRKTIIDAKSKIEALNKFLLKYNENSYEYIIIFIERIK